MNRRIEDYLVPGVPADRIRARFELADGNELASGKFFSPESSAALAANTFGLFLGQESLLPPLPGTADLGWPATMVEIEASVRLPWRGGRHPNLDALIAVDAAIIGVESKRYEPFRPKSAKKLSAAYDRKEWGANMAGYERIRDGVRDGTSPYRHLDAAQLLKHALALFTATQRVDAHLGKTPVLYYLFAEPDTWADGREVRPRDKAAHRDEIRLFAETVVGNDVAFLSCAYSELLALWTRSGDSRIAAHADAIAGRFLNSGMKAARD